MNPSSLRLIRPSLNTTYSATPSPSQKVIISPTPSLQNTTPYSKAISSSHYPFNSPCTSISSVPVTFARYFSHRPNTSNFPLRKPFHPCQPQSDKVGESLAFSSPPNPPSERAERRSDPLLEKNDAKLELERTGIDLSDSHGWDRKNQPNDPPEKTYIPNREGGAEGWRENRNMDRPSGNLASGRSNKDDQGESENWKREDEKREKAEKWKREGEEIERIQIKGDEEAGMNEGMKENRSKPSNMGGSGGSPMSSTGGGNRGNNEGLSGGSSGITGMGRVGNLNDSGAIGGVGPSQQKRNKSTNSKNSKFSTPSSSAPSPPAGKTASAKKSNRPDPHQEVRNYRESEGISKEENHKRDTNFSSDDPALKAVRKGAEEKMKKGGSSNDYSLPTPHTFREDIHHRDQSEFAKNRKLEVHQPSQFDKQ